MADLSDDQLAWRPSARAHSIGFTSRFMNGTSTLGEVVVVCMSHDNRHLGEIEYINGLLGLKGSATI